MFVILPETISEDVCKMSQSFFFRARTSIDFSDALCGFLIFLDTLVGLLLTRNQLVTNASTDTNCHS